MGFSFFIYCIFSCFSIFTLLFAIIVNRERLVGLAFELYGKTVFFCFYLDHPIRRMSFCKSPISPTHTTRQSEQCSSLCMYFILRVKCLSMCSFNGDDMTDTMHTITVSPPFYNININKNCAIMLISCRRVFYSLFKSTSTLNVVHSTFYSQLLFWCVTLLLNEYLVNSLHNMAFTRACSTIFRHCKRDYRYFAMSLEIRFQM